MPQTTENPIARYMSPLRQSQKDKLRKIYDRIRRTNAAFEKATPEKKRVMIAKDVILQLDLKRIVPRSTYFDQDDAQDAARYTADTADVEVRDIFRQMPDCNVCGIGSCFVAVVERVDDLTSRKAHSLGGIANRNVQVAYLVRHGIFTRDHLDIIESCFESDQKHQKRRLRRMMERIVEHKGVMTEEMFYDLYPGEQR